jgi:hypothetical protein
MQAHAVISKTNKKMTKNIGQQKIPYDKKLFMGKDIKKLSHLLL